MTTAMTSSDVTTELLALEERRQRALIAVDLDDLAAIMADDLIHIHAPGVTHTKQQLLEHTATRRAYLQITRGELLVRVYGDTAVLTGPIRNRLRTADGGERELGGVAMQVLRRGDDGAWRFVSFQMTPAGEEAWPPLPSQQDGDSAAGKDDE